jgi:uncharacterized cofD-like protein
MKMTRSLHRCGGGVALRPKEEVSTAEFMPELNCAQTYLVRTVAFGGGTGLPNLLKGLKQYVVPNRPFVASGTYISALAAVVAVTDDGGSSGRLREEFNLHPPGDIRNCIAALSEDDSLLSRLFQHRFESDSELNGHSFGNLFLTALATITGDFAEAVKQSSVILNTSGHIYPATSSSVRLEAVMADGRRVVGETNITSSIGRIVEVNLLPGDVLPLPQTLDEIAQADLIIIGPGSLFTSLVPNLLVGGIADAVAASDATKVFVCNLMTEANESLGLSAADHIRVINSYAQRRIIDFALVNRIPVSCEVKANYAMEGSNQILVDIDAIRALGVKVILGDYLEEAEGVARHAGRPVARDLLNLAAQTLQSKRRLVCA